MTVLCDLWSKDGRQILYARVWVDLQGGYFPRAVTYQGMYFVLKGGILGNKYCQVNISVAEAGTQPTRVLTSLTTVDQVRSVIVDGISNVLGRWIVTSRLTSDQLAVLKAVRLVTASDDQFLREVLDKLPNCYEKESTVASEELHAALAAKAIDWKGLLAKVEAALKVGSEVVVPLVADLLQLLLGYIPKSAPADDGCPADHGQCCQATLCAALQTAVLAASCCYQCEDSV